MSGRIISVRLGNGDATPSIRILVLAYWISLSRVAHRDLQVGREDVDNDAPAGGEMPPHATEAGVDLFALQQMGE